MKKIVTLGAIAVLAAGFIFADEPAADVSVTEFKGEAKVTWGMDLDAMKTGFKNTASADFKVKLFNGGEKVTEGEGVWAELKVKTDGLKFEKGEKKDGTASLETATIHINDFFVGIKEGDCDYGDYKFDTAIRSNDNDSAKWIPSNPLWFGDKAWKYKYGIQAGYDTSDLAVKLDLRSIVDPDKKFTQYTNSYAVRLQGELKDSNQWLEGLAVKAGFNYNLSGEYYYNKDLEGADEAELKDGKPVYELDYYTKDGVKTKAKTKKGAAAANAAQAARTWLNIGESADGVNWVQNGHSFGYGANVAYKFKLDDTYFVKPQVAFSGYSDSIEANYGDNKWGKLSKSANFLAFGALFGWGSTSDNVGVPFLSGDEAKKSQPGVSVVVEIPLASTSKAVLDKTYTKKSHEAVLAVITPAFCTKGELVEGLSAGLYSEIALLRYKDDPNTTNASYHDASYTKTNDDRTNSETWNNAAWKDEKFALALAGGLKYDIKSGEYTITPQFGFRFANTAYVENKINNRTPLSTNKVFDKMGEQDKLWDVNNSKVKYGNGGYIAGWLNIKASVDFAGFINNTTFSLEYESANLMNKTDYHSKEYNRNGATIANPLYHEGNGSGSKYYNVKLGHFDVGCKIAF